MKCLQLHRRIVIAFLLCLLIGCRHTIGSAADFQQWLSQEENGLIQQKKSNNLALTAKYLPPQYLALRDLSAFEHPSKAVYDSLLETYTHSLTFLLTISPNKTKQAAGDIMYRGIKDYLAYKERVSQLNFGIKKYIRLHTKNKTFKPVLAAFDNTYSLVEHRSVYLVFTEDELESGFLDGEELDLVFNDEIFQTGINHFKFKREDILNIPSIKILD
ncbi:MAG: hypothetical protein ACPGJS_05880 [Flammeovirgaceae bacterium]